MTRTLIENRVLTVEGVDLFDGMGPEASVEAASRGAFVTLRRAEPTARMEHSLGNLRRFRRFLACFRYEPFWMKPCVGTALAAVPIDTQFALFELDTGKLVLVVPLISAPFRTSLVGRKEGLAAVCDTGDPSARATSALALYVAVGDDPHVLARDGAAVVAERLGTVTLRRDKPLPAFVDTFGWCTWDAFYQDVSLEKMKQGLESFRRGGVEPRTIILDDGWQSVRTTDTGERRLTAFSANEKFPGGVREAVRVAKQEYAIHTFLVWHAVHGYWGGVDGDALPGYGVETVLRWYSPEVLSHQPAFNCVWWGACVGRPSAQEIGRFYADYHRALAAEGVDGVKVDNQSSVEGVAHGQGGRVAFMRAHREGLEASVHANFGGTLINCMSLSSEMLYHARASTLTRSSTDFWPNIPSSHGLHVYTNAVFGLWFGQFVHPDWDMFQSGHPAGAYHAAARAVSGSSIYVSDKPDAHDFDLLRKLVLSDGRVLRARGVGVPTRDCLFTDPLTEPALFKVVNENSGGAVVGVFNARYRDGGDRLTGTTGPADVPGLSGERFAVYLGRADRLVELGPREHVEVTLDTLEAEVATLVPLDRGFAPIGLVDKLNPGGAVVAKGWEGSRYHVHLEDGGHFCAWSEHRPRSVRCDGTPLAFEHADGRLRVDVPAGGQRRLDIEFAGA